MPNEADPPSEREFFEYALERAKHEHDQLTDAWKQIDTKAQATAVIAGVFLAATFAFVRIGVQPTYDERWILCLTVASLVGTIAMSAVAMLTKSAFIPITGVEAARMVKDALRFPGEASPRYNGLLADTMDNWSAVNAQLSRIVNKKAGNLRLAQWALLLSASGVMLNTVAALLNH